MTNKEQIKKEANIEFNGGNYFSAFQILWKAGVNDFVKYAESKEWTGNRWLTQGQSAILFWRDFILEDTVFQELLNSDNADHLLHLYFTKSNTTSKEFILKLSVEYSELFVKAVRHNRYFITSNSINFLCSIQLPQNLRLHQKTWQKIQNEESKLWKTIDLELGQLKEFSLSDLFIQTVIWLESSRFGESPKDIFHLSSVYNLFVEYVFILRRVEISQKSGGFSESTFRQNFRKVCFSSRGNEGQISKFLDAISNWIAFKEQVMDPYCFDESFIPMEENEELFLKSNPNSYYNWLVDGIRYNFSQLNYFNKGESVVLDAEERGFLKISKGKLPFDEETNRLLQIQKCSTRILLHDMGIDEFQIGGQSFPSELLLSPLLTHSLNSWSRYERSINKYFNFSKDWKEAFKYAMKESSVDQIAREPFILTSKEDYIIQNQIVNPSVDKSVTEALLNLFGYKSSKNKSFDRFNIQYDVWQKPFLIIDNHIFTPLIFHGNNIWFYAFGQAALRQSKEPSTKRSQTKKMEAFLGQAFKRKGWKVEIDGEDDKLTAEGDIDLIVESNNKTLLIQLKRTYFRLNPKDVYYESVLVDKKATKQLNEGENWLTSHGISLIDQVKWIVSTSFENIGATYEGCKKINYFELLNALENPNILSLKDLVSELELDKDLQRFKAEYHENLTHIGHNELIQETGIELSLFSFRDYKIFIGTDNETGSGSYLSTFNFALDLYNMDKKWASLPLLQKCLSINSKDGEVWNALGTTLADVGKFTEAIEAFQKALNLFPSDPFIMFNYSRVLLESGQKAKGLELLLDLYEKYPLIENILPEIEHSFDKCIHELALSSEDLITLATRWENIKYKD